MRAPMIPGRKPDDDQREAMLRRLGIAEEKPALPSRWDVLARNLEPAAPVQTPPPIVDETLPAHQPIPMADAPRAYEAAEPALHAVEPEPAPVHRDRVPDASFMSGWGEESIPEDEDEEVEAQAVDDPEPPAPVHESRWMDEPLAEAPRREELLPRIERPVTYAPPSVAERVANDDDLSIPKPQAVAPVAAPVVADPVIEPPVTRAPVAEPVVQPIVAPEPAIEARVVPPPAIEPPAPEPEPPVVQRAAPAPAPEPAPPVDSALREMRAELEAMRKQFQTAPAAPIEAAPLAAAIPYDGRRKSRQQTDFFANARMVVWTLAIVAALWVIFHGMQAAKAHQARQDHIMATVTGKEAADQKSDN